MAVGGGFSKTSQNPNMVSIEALESLLAEFCKEIYVQGKQIIIQYNNLENIPTKTLADLFKSIRDYLQIDGLHTLFLAPPSILDTIEQNRQVHSTFNHTINLDSMPDNGVVEILKRRCDFLKEHENYIKPYEDDTVKKLYNLMNRSLRYTFKVLEDATIFTEPKAPCIVTMDEIKLVQENEKREILSNLTDTQSKIVKALLENPKMMQKEISKKTGIGITNLTTPIRELKDKGILLIQQNQKDKRVKHIKLSEDTYLRLCFTLDSLKNDF